MLKLKLEGEVVEEAIEKIIEDIRDRKGLGDEWDQIDEDIQSEIKNKWVSIIINILPEKAYRI